MIGINVRVDAAAGVDYPALILTGEKGLETRNSPSLHPYLNKRVAIVRTGAGKAEAIGMVTIADYFIMEEFEFRMARHLHHVPKGSAFDVKPGGRKWCYLLRDPEFFPEPRPVAHGIIARQVL